MSDCEPYLGHDDRHALSSDASISTGTPWFGGPNVDTTLVLGVSSTVGQNRPAPGRELRLTLAAVVRPLTSPLPYRFSAGRDRHTRSTGTCAVPCRREAAQG